MTMNDSDGDDNNNTNDNNANTNNKITFPERSRDHRTRSGVFWLPRQARTPGLVLAGGLRHQRPPLALAPDLPAWHGRRPGQEGGAVLLHAPANYRQVRDLG